jgi:hypothetical protein
MQLSTAFKQSFTPVEPNIQYTEEVIYLTVSSRDRDVILYPNPSSYTVTLDQEIKNIHSIELFRSILPNKNGLVDEPYLTLKIAEINNTFSTNDNTLNSAFAMIPIHFQTAGNFIHSDTHENVKKIFYGASKASLGRLTISLHKEDGSLFSFGTDTPDPPNKLFQNTFIFKISIFNKNRTPLDFRNVY